ncbi:helix-turn-helix domain-containing protein [Streptomyces albiflavescens]|uniref:helix-turn-helix domain-containing protein n=1 Tax=Streptomyces albiflavescens TaxID=1623582 RepID=UPI003570F645
MHLRYSFRIEPTPGQRTALARTFGCARVVYNFPLQARPVERGTHPKPQPVTTGRQAGGNPPPFLGGGGCQVRMWQWHG